MFRFATRTVTRAAPTLRLSAVRYQSSNALTQGTKPFGSGPAIVRYTSQHEWIAAHSDNTAYIGITKYAADALGDATYIELPSVGDVIESGDSIGSVESVKSASEIYQPVSAEILEVNEALVDSPGLINEDPMGAGWLTRVQLQGKLEDSAEELLTLEEYEASLKEDH